MATYTSATTVIGDAATSTTLLAERIKRRGGVIRNQSSARLYISMGATATTSSPLYLDQDEIYIIDAMQGGDVYSGIITGIWASDASGSAYVQEIY